MKIKCLLTAAAVFASLSGTALAASDSAADSENQSGIVNSDSVDAENSDNETESTNSETESSDEQSETAESDNSADEENSDDSSDGVIVEEMVSDGNVDTGIGSIAAVVGIVTIAGAAVVVSRKK